MRRSLLLGLAAVLFLGGIVVGRSGAAAQTLSPTMPQAPSPMMNQMMGEMMGSMMTQMMQDPGMMEAMAQTCLKAMEDPEMQQTMREMMQNPQMQQMMEDMVR